MGDVGKKIMMTALDLKILYGIKKTTTVDEVSRLLDDGAKLELRGESGWSPVVSAVYEGNLGVVRFMCERGAYMDIRFCMSDEGGGNTGLLTLASRGGSLGVVDYLVSKGFDVNDEDENHWTPLMWAASAGRVCVIESLLRYGANIEHKDFFGFTPLMHAAHGGKDAAVHALLNYGADINVRSKSGDKSNAVSLAGSSGYPDTVELLLARGGERSRSDIEKIVGACCSGMDVGEGGIAMLNNLLDEGLVHPNDDLQSLGDGRSLLTMAVVSVNMPVIEILLSRGGDISLPDENGDTPMTLVDSCGESDLVSVMEALFLRQDALLARNRSGSGDSWVGL